MKILITGGGGYIGRHVVAEALKQGHEVIVVDTHGTTQGMAKLVKADIFTDDSEIYTKLGSPEVLIHLAWRDGFMHNSPEHMKNLSSHVNFLRNYAMGGGKNIVVMGSMHEIGYWEGAVDENTPCTPLSQYGIAKNALRQSMMLAAQELSFNLYWLRAYYIFGDDEQGSSIFAKIVQAAKEGKEDFPFTSGKNKYDFLEIDELARQIIATATQEKIQGIINVCSGEPVSLGEQVEWFIKKHQYNMKLKYGSFPDRPYDSPAIWGDNSKIKKILELAA